VRGQVDGRAAAAFENARHIAGAEQSLGLFVEPAVHAWAEAHAWVIDAASWMYVNSHFTVTTGALAFLYLRRNEQFYFVRNMFMVAMAIALVGYVAFPTAPPRFLPELGFHDSVADFTGVGSHTSNLLVNPFAAVPSMPWRSR
jgi:cytochrome bd-type quinol oxidase subunit 2